MSEKTYVYCDLCKGQRGEAKEGRGKMSKLFMEIISGGDLIYEGEFKYDYEQVCWNCQRLIREQIPLLLDKVAKAVTERKDFEKV